MNREKLTGSKYQVVMQAPGAGYRHVLTAEEIRDRLAQLPAHFVAPLEVVQLSRMTRKKLSFPCYGMQWGPAIYLYPVEESLVEQYKSPPKPAADYRSAECTGALGIGEDRLVESWCGPNGRSRISISITF